MSSFPCATRRGLMSRTGIGRCLVPAAPLLIVLLVAVSVAGASVPASPGWTISSSAAPSTFSSADNEQCSGPAGYNEQFEECDTYEVTVVNTGKLTSSGEASLVDRVPAGLTIQPHENGAGGVRLYWSQVNKGEVNIASSDCSVAGQVVTCAKGLSDVAPDATLRLQILVEVELGASFPGACPAGYPQSNGCVTNEAEISGGGAPTVRTEEPVSRPNLVNGPQAEFGFESFAFDTNGPNGAVDRQAGDHPYELAVKASFETKFRHESRGRVLARSAPSVRDVVTDLPVGFVGSILAAPQCTFSQLSSHVLGGVAGCPRDTVVGHIRTFPAVGGAIDGPIYNMTPEEGYPAEFAYVDELGGPHGFYAHVVPSPRGYVLQTINPDLPELPLSSFEVVLYGDPAEKDETHNQQIPFFTDSSDCGAAPTATIYMDSWENPGRFRPDGEPVNLEEEADGKRVWAKAESTAPPTLGCNALQFPAEIGAQPTTEEADTPSGVNFDIKVPQVETIGVPATPTLRKVVETFPEGFTVDPAAGDGLGACSANPAAEPGSPENQIGWLGQYGPHGEKLPGDGALNFSDAPPACPEASKVGALELETPLIGARKLQGEIFLAKEYENPYDSLIGLYVVVHDPITGVLIKIAGKATLNSNTGQITGEFEENPNLPFSNLELHFFGGPRAEFATPEHCGAFTTTTELLPYSFPDSGGPANPFDTFVVDQKCPNGAFAPSFTAGSQNLQAGAYTNFVASFQRSDTEEELAGLTVTLPPGLSADVSGVPECTGAELAEAEAGTGGCPADTQVGVVKAGVGPGPDPFFAGGKAFWTGPYNGGPFGIAVVVPAVAGPFNFGTVVVRQSIRIDQKTAQVTDVSDPFPTIIDGVPLRMRRVDVEFNRSGFAFNPTNCAQEQFAGTVTGFPLGAPTSVNGHRVGYAIQPGGSSQFTSPFQVTNCANLKFAPKFQVSTSGKVSRTDGTSLSVKLSYPEGALGTQANIRQVKVELPRDLPSRLGTLRKACTQTQFQANPAGCPAASAIGYVKAVVPNIPVPLEGPAYFVSNGGEAWPNLVLVLQGDGVTIDLVGDTQISKAGITSTTFKAVPDNPVSSFELALHNGPYSALTGLGNLCTERLAMPTEFVAQNGAEIHENTRVAVSGCPKGVHAKLKHKKAKHRGNHHKKAAKHATRGR